MSQYSAWKVNKEEFVAENGIVTAALPLSAEAGLSILKAGGNAIDAAVAIGFCNVVQEPYMASIGGMGYMVVHLADEAKTIGVDFNGRAPQGTTDEMYDVIGPSTGAGYKTFDVVDDANNSGPLSATVPATCAGFCEAHKRFGVLPLEQVLEPAIALASNGFDANWYLTMSAANMYDTFNSDSQLSSVWLPGGKVPKSHPKPATKIIQKDLAHLLENLAKKGRDAMYSGDVAEAIDEHMKKGGGVLRRKDLEDYQPVVGGTANTNFGKYDVNVVNTPSGGITNLQTLNILNNFDLKNMGHNTAEYLHTFMMSARHAFADRFGYLGDWEHHDIPINGLLSSSYAKEIAKQVKAPTFEIRDLGQREPLVEFMENPIHDPWNYDTKQKVPVPSHPAMDTNSEDTTHINVVDKDRNAVSCTHTGVFAKGLNPAGTGVAMVGGMGWFIPKPGYPNSMAPWKRPMNNMSPFMVLENNRPILMQGAPGARRIMNRNAQVILNVLVFGMSPQEAIIQPVVDVSGRKTFIDSRMDSSIVNSLIDLGHDIDLLEEEPAPTGYFARPSAIQIDYGKNILKAGVDAYRPTTALGY
ncbi:MAG: gamma-glutamyltransferase family protein [Chloroflexota bacterium]|nr:gamma-glutamyltransferase family protein [Chloroflexota bacterium]